MRNRVLVFVEAVDVAAEGAVWYARTISGGKFEALHVPGKRTDTGINARWFDLTAGRSLLEIKEGTDPTAAVLAAVERLRAESDDTFVTVVVPEQFHRRSLLAAAQRAQFRLKLRLLVEPRTVVADVPAVTSSRRPQGNEPERLVVRVLAGEPDEATQLAAEYARGLATDDVRAVHFGERGWAAGDLGLELDDEPLEGRLGDAVLSYVRRLTGDPAAAVNVVLSERIRPGLKHFRSRRALAVKRCLLFEPHVILSSVPRRIQD